MKKQEKEQTRTKKFTEDELFDIGAEIQSKLKLDIRDGQIFAILDGEEIKTKIYPVKMVRKYLRNYFKHVNIHNYFVEDMVHHTDEDYIEKYDDIYILAVDRLTDDEAGIMALDIILEKHINEIEDFESALKIIKKYIGEILETEILSDVEMTLETHREYIYFNEIKRCEEDFLK